ncbi:MAG: hypothetical protein AAGK78_07410, partial [Planctomycetota bacterium]
MQTAEAAIPAEVSATTPAEPTASGGHTSEGGSGGESSDGGGEGAASSAETAVDSRVADAGNAGIGSREAMRDVAITRYDEAVSALSEVPGRSASLSTGIDFSEGPAQTATASVQRQTAIARIRSFMAQSAAQIQDAVVFAQSEAPARLSAMAETTKANLAASIEAEKAEISSRIQAAKSLAITSATAAKAQLSADYAIKVALVNAETDSAVAALEGQYVQSTES